MDILIRRETPKDYPSIYKVNCEAFGKNNEAQLVDRLRYCKSFIPELSLVATINDHIVGYILFTKIQIGSKESETNSLALAPISISPEYQSKGIGSKLIKVGLKEASNMGYKSVIVLGNENYYSRFGFKLANRWGIEAPFNIPANAFMALELQEGSLSNIRGKVIYSEEFSHI